MCRIDPYVRLSADNNGETKCVIFVDDLNSAKQKLRNYTSKIVGFYPFISAFAAHISVHSLSDLAALPCVKTVSGHSTVSCCMDKTALYINLDSEKADGFYGQGVTAAVIDTGLNAHLDFFMPKDRVRFVDFIQGLEDPYDDNGHGTAVASILCGNGLVSGGRLKGIAPKAEIIALKAIGNNGEGGAFKILEAMQWIHSNRHKYNIRVVCMSFGSDPLEEGIDPLALGASALAKSGITVVASAGNDGPAKGSVKSPGISPDVITVGGAEIKEGTVTVAEFSSRGPAGRTVKPDIIAPSVDIKCCCAKGFYTSMTGTSMAAPVVAGVAALLYSKNPQLRPDRVKELILNNALRLPYEPNSCGAGLLDSSFLSELA